MTVDDPVEELAALLRPLLRFYSSRGLGSAADDLANEVLARVLAKVRQGKRIDSLSAFTFGVAKIVLLEKLRNLKQTPAAMPEQVMAPAAESQEYHDCLDTCLAALEPETRALVLSYYSAGDESNSGRRAQLAKDAGMSVNALHLRISRLRSRLRTCVTNCVARGLHEFSTGIGA